jgi:hypothetical protein
MIFSGCSYRVLDFTLVSTKNVDLSKASSFERGKQRVEGLDKVHIIISIPTGRPNLKEAVDRAIETTPGCIALVDGVIYSKSWWAILYGQISYLVEGTPLIDKNLTINSSNIPKYGRITINKDGKTESIESISSFEYFALKDKIVKDSKEKRFKNSTELE